jgi:hypothetical protein
MEHLAAADGDASTFLTRSSKVLSLSLAADDDVRRIDRRLGQILRISFGRNHFFVNDIFKSFYLRRIILNKLIKYINLK